MLNIPELEKRWLHYKIKSYTPYLIIFISLIIIFTVIVMLLNTESDKKSTLENPSTSAAIVKTSPPKDVKVEIPTINVAHPIEDSFVKKQKKQEQSRTLAPSMDFMKQMQSSSQPYYEYDNSDDREFSQKKKVSQAKDKVEDIIEEVVIEEIPEVDNEPSQLLDQTSKKITINRKDSNKDILEIITRFKKNNNPALSLFVAKKYYELENYHQSYNYALITNQINNEIEASWLIFAKSLVKLGEKEMAIKTLKKYITQTNSSSAQTLLNEITLGKFK